VQPLQPKSGARPAAAVVNVETLQQLEELGSSFAFIEKLVGVFLTDSAATLERMEKALVAHEHREFRSLVHALKGSSASMGTDRLTSLCSRLGSLSDAELRLQAPALQREFTQELVAARAQFERHLAERVKSVG
jgi:HPt (histidine-containing phosphotransfer) domain-containing protein